MRLINKVCLHFGEAGRTTPLEFKPTGVTIFVGPNNSGKSLALREIEKISVSNDTMGNHIARNIEFNIPESSYITQELQLRKTTPTKDENVPAGSVVIQRANTYKGLRPREIIPLNQVGAWANKKNLIALTRYYISLLTVRLDAQTRTTLLNPQVKGDLLEAPVNILSALWDDDVLRKTIRDLTSESFGKYFTIDALNANQLRARMADRPPEDTSEEQSLDKRSRDYHRGAIEIIDASDGVKAFTGMIATVIGKNYRIPLIDEPEAFLHPPLAKRFGKELAELSAKREANVFAATHSADFLMGCVSGSPQVNIVRLTYKNGTATARLLDHERLSEIIKSPLMRSTGVLSALFHEGAVACESDSDRAIYQEINDRLSQFDKAHSSEAIFLNAHTWQSTAKIAGPLREMGIPAAVVVDFDAFKRGHDFKNLLKDLNIAEAVVDGLNRIKEKIAFHCEEKNIDWKSTGKAAIEDQEIILSLDVLLNNLGQHGVFVVPGGELEIWFVGEGIEYTKNKPKWLLDAFEKLGGNPEDPAYMKPTQSGVWEFIRSISAWINKPDRAGM